jgi:amino acid adenylation domain-containing protein
MPPPYRGSEIAIVGQVARLPGARDLEELWANLAAGVESIRLLTAEEQGEIGLAADLRSRPGYVPAVAQLAGYDLFDAAFFGVNPREAELMDPQHRVLLECAWEALEDAGYDPASYRGRVGVFAGATTSTYLLMNLATHPGLDRLQVAIGNAVDSLATRVSYKLDLKGPSHTVQSACSTALLAVHLACQSLLNEECDMALAGGVSIDVGQRGGYLYQPDSILSPDGHCRAFDAAAAGTVFGSGAGVVVLKRLADALADGDAIRAVVLGSAVNNDGAAKVGFTAPSVTGQAEVVVEALATAGAAPDSISYVEAHGTGTALGDPIEVQALTRAFRAGTARRGFCALGSIKSNLGHLDVAAGAAGLIKTVLALEHGQIPPSLHCARPNPKIDFAASPFYVNTALAEWPRGAAPRRAGVSAFGVGGTNVHLVLEEAPPVPAPAAPALTRPWHLLALSARTESALDAATERLAGHLARHPAIDLADAAYTLLAGRRAFDLRRFLVCRDTLDAAADLAAADPQRVPTAEVPWQGGGRPVVFLFPGQGAQHLGMGRGLYASEPVFRREVDRSAEILAPHLGLDLRRLIDPAPDEAEEMERRLAGTDVAQPAQLAVELALARLLASWGIAPKAMIGHSLGEYAAACLAGVLELPDALALVALRGRLLARATGAMLSISLPGEEVEAMLHGREEEIAVSGYNGPAHCTASGSAEAIGELARELAARGVDHRPLHVAAAAHSPRVEPVLAEFRAAVRRVRLAPPQIPYVSTLTGTWITAEQATDPETWVRHLRQPVRFSAGLLALRQGEPDAVLLEVGPGQALATLARRHLEGSAGPPPRDAARDHPILAAMRHPRDPSADLAVLLQAVGRLWLAGATIDWQGFHAGQARRRLPLPTYPFERQRYWIDTRIEAPDARIDAPAAAPAAPWSPASAGAAAERAPAASPAPVASPPTPGTLHERPRLRTGYVAPRGILEEEVAAIWREILGIERVGAEDNFFELGGHSLLATQLASRLRAAFAVDLSVQDALDAASVAGMADAVARQLLAARRRAPAAGVADDLPQSAAVAESAPPQPLAPSTERAIDRAIDRAIAPREPGASRLPLSFAQERMWFLHQLDPETSAYNLFNAIAVDGPLQLPVLVRCLAEVTRRHEDLRTTFPIEAGTPVEAVAPAALPPLPWIDLGALPAAVRRAEVERLAAEEQARPFDLARGPLLRFAVARLGEGEHTGLLTMHHIISDGWSNVVLMREIAALYEAFAAGRPSPLPALPIQYADFALWQRRWLQGEALEAELAYWRAELAGPLPTLRLAADFDRASAQGFAAGQAVRVLPPALVQALRELGGGRGATLFMTLLAGFAALLGRYSGEEDILVGAPIANRNRRELEGLIGFFLNTLVLRTRPRLERGYIALLDQVRRAAGGAYAHQDLPLEMALRALDQERDLRAPPFQVMFLLQNLPAPRLEFAGLTLAVSRAELDVDLAAEIFELGLAAEESAGGVALMLDYNALLFTEGTAARLLEHLERLLGAAAAEPERPLGELALLSAAERRQLVAWSEPSPAAGEPPAAAPLLVHRAFAAQAARTPDAPAVVHEGRTLRYGELAAEVAALSRRLRARGIGPEARVAIGLERSPRMVVALLAVIAAGGAYVPLDPTHPVERLALILRDVGAAALLTGSGSAGMRQAAALADVPAICLDAAAPAESGPEPAGEPNLELELEDDADHLAYVIYTSGSTGTPKGVMIRHGGLARYVAAARRQLALTPADRVLQFASLGFDASVEEIFPCLTSGAALVLRTEAMLGSAEAFLSTCESWGITAVDLPTAFWQELVSMVEAGMGAWPPALRLLIVGGERALPERVARLRRQLGPGVRVVNTYGPTEITVVATAHVFTGTLGAAGDPPEFRELPIGRPLENVSVHVLDATLERSPLGVPGELCVGGEGVARGYLGRPRLTARAFVPDPFAGVPGARMYRTGDLARYLPDGELEFLGRIDRQVKVRGYRIELGEIEGTLARHPAVGEVAAGVHERHPGDRTLVAWWVAQPGRTATAGELRAFLKERLPEAMVPALFPLLPALPRTVSGKLDRRALPAPEAGLEPQLEGFEAPSTPAEEAVASLWSELLGLPRIGRDGDFFALGGHSLLLPRVLHRLEQDFGIKVPLHSLIEHTTVAALALVVEEVLLDQIEIDEPAGCEDAG